MNKTMTSITRAQKYIQARTDIVPEIAIILGSGLGYLIDDVVVKAVANHASMKVWGVSAITNKATGGGRNRSQITIRRLWQWQKSLAKSLCGLYVM